MTCVGLLPLVLGSLLGGLAPAQQVQPFYKSEAYTGLRLDGYEVIKETGVELNEDGFMDAIVVERSGEGISLSAWLWMQEGGYKMIFRSKPLAASELADLTPMSLGASHRAWLLDVYEDSPDEEEHGLKLFLVEKQNIREIFTSVYKKNHPEEDAGRKKVRIVDLGGIETGFKIEPQQNSWPVLKVHDASKKIVHQVKNHDPVWVIIGMRERFFAFSKGRYNSVKDHYLDYLPKLGPLAITSAGENIDKDQPIGDSSWSAVLSDQDTSTGWDVQKPAKSQTLHMSFQTSKTIRMLRLVPFCEGRKENLEPYGKLVEFEIRFDKQAPIRISREKDRLQDSRIELVEDFGLPGSKIGIQTLVFFSKPIQARSVNLIVQKVEKDTVTACISEISIHRSIKDSNIYQKTSDDS